MWKHFISRSVSLKISSFINHRYYGRKWRGKITYFTFGCTSSAHWSWDAIASSVTPIIRRTAGPQQVERKVLYRCSIATLCHSSNGHRFERYASSLNRKQSGLQTPNSRRPSWSSQNIHRRHALCNITAHIQSKNRYLIRIRFED